VRNGPDPGIFKSRYGGDRVKNNGEEGSRLINNYEKGKMRANVGGRKEEERVWRGLAMEPTP